MPKLEKILDETKNDGEQYKIYTTSKLTNIMEKIQDYFVAKHFIDVVLIAGDHRIPAHRLVLSAVSDYFAAMFTTNMLESKQYEIELREIDSTALQSLVLFCYSGTVRINEGNVRILLETSRQLLIEEVEEFCVSFLKEKLSLKTCFRIRDFADSMTCKSLLEAARKYIADHFVEAMKMEDFCSLPANELEIFFSNHDLNVPSEAVAFQALMQWVEYDVMERCAVIGRLISHIKLPLLPTDFIVDNMKNEPLFNEDPKCCELMMEAFEYHLVPELRPKMQSERTRARPSVVGEICAVGRIDSTQPTVKVERYDTSEDKWVSVAKLSETRLQFGVTEFDSMLCVVGGHHGPMILNSVECFNMRTHARTSDMPPINTARYGMGVGVVRDVMCATGGHDGRNYINTVECYNPGTGVWTYAAPMLVNRFRSGVVTLGDMLYSIGGINDGGRLCTVERYDPFKNQWTVCRPMARARNAVGVGVLNGAIYAVGGVDRSVLASVERYDPRMDSWTTVASMSTGRARLGVCALGPWLYAAGGYNSGGNFLKHTEVYYPETDEWALLSPLNEICAANLLVIKSNRN